jgi:DNA-binding HxlR family transcriptional regulator
MLAQNLRKLEADGIVVRRDLTEIVLHVEYNLRDEVRTVVCEVMDTLAQCADVLLGSAGDSSEKSYAVGYDSAVSAPQLHDHGPNAPDK